MKSACGTLPSSQNGPDQRVELSDTAELYREFLVSPTSAKYLAAILAFASDSDDSTPSLLSMEHACQNGQYQTASSLSAQWTKSFALSPHFHRLSAIAARELGHFDEAEMERFACETCLNAIIVSGEGSPSAPYLVAQRSDTQEVLAKLGVKAIRQMRRENDGRLCDVFEVSSTGKKTETVWFLLAPDLVARPSNANSLERQSTKNSKRRIRRKVQV